MIKISDETVITYSAAVESLPGNPALSTLHRWRREGFKGVKLETVLIRGRRFTSKEAIERFVEATTKAAASC